MKKIFVFTRPVLLIIALFAAITFAAVIADKSSSVAAISDNGASQNVTFIIDAGHGGEDGGAVSASGAKESDINLSIAKKLGLMLRFFGARAIMTRESDIIEYPDSADSVRERKRADISERTKIANTTPGAVLISIHQNKYTDSRPFGAQVLYNEQARAFAELLQASLICNIDPANYRPAVLASKDIYLMAHAECPAVLIECGFLSNDAECARLLTEGYQIKLAAVITACTLYNKNAYS